MKTAKQMYPGFKFVDVQILFPTGAAALRERRA